jgi:hypothetical protein
MQVFVGAFVEQGLVMSVERMADERLIYLYENIRQQVEARRGTPSDATHASINVRSPGWLI